MAKRRNDGRFQNQGWHALFDWIRLWELGEEVSSQKDLLAMERFEILESVYSQFEIGKYFAANYSLFHSLVIHSLKDLKNQCEWGLSCCLKCERILVCL